MRLHASDVWHWFASDSLRGDGWVHWVIIWVLALLATLTLSPLVVH